MNPEGIGEDLEAISQMIAERTIKRGIRRIITQEILAERCLYYTEVAKQELEKFGPGNGNPDSSDFQPTATIFMADGEEAPNVRVGFRDGHKRSKMKALSLTCQTLLAQAVIMRIVATICRTDKVGEAMGLNSPDPHDRQKREYFEERMWKWIEKYYGKARLSSLPPELRTDIIMVGGMGPKLQDTGAMTEYRWENGKLVFGKTNTSGEMHMEMVPRWWQ